MAKQDIISEYAALFGEQRAIFFVDLFWRARLILEDWSIYPKISKAVLESNYVEFVAPSFPMNLRDWYTILESNKFIESYIVAGRLILKFEL